MPIPQAIIKLVERFELQRQAYQSGKYNEAQIRAEFIDPFFKVLGWDVHNEQGYAEAYKDVIHEDALKMGGATEAPDLCFRIGGTRKFFVECKKPSINIKDDVHPAYQLRRYAWSARLPLSILTDFDELAVYDCRAKPNKNDSASACRLMYLTGKQYAEKWDELAAIFSREAVLKGSFDKFAESAKGKKGTTGVDDAFLEEIERWRDLLAHNIAIRNEKLSQRELNFAVQRTIDRIIFLRICEDRGIEPYGRLLTLKNGERAYPRLCEFFRRADERYNSGIFCFTKNNEPGGEPPDELTLTLTIDDKVIKDIVGNLYYPESPYEFSVLPADILGQVYERFLGKVIRLTAGHQAKVEDKPEVRKAGGVYYTPTYIVDYIVKNTVGKLLEGKTPRQAAKLKILDPACGSGSFLLGAYQYLLNWHRDYYVQQMKVGSDRRADRGRPGKASSPIYQSSGGDYRLTTAERKRVLLNNIYGVDIDTQAVEVTKLSLLLKVLEGESQETITKQFELFHQRALPDLGSNIKCGNSLIGPDFYQQQEMKLLDDESRYRINAFDWQAEFAEIFKAGGFDVVISNPPYIFTREQLSEVERQYFTDHFKLSWEKHNTFMLFMEMLLRLLNKSGCGGFIVPNSWLTIESGHLLREKYIKRLELVADLNYAAFHRVSMEPCIFIVSGRDTKSDVEVLRAGSKDAFLSLSPTTLKRAVWSEADCRIVLASSAGIMKVLDKVISNSCPVESRFDVRTGLQAYEQGKGTPPQTERDVREHVFDRAKHEDEKSIRYLEGRNVSRNNLSWSRMWMQYGTWLAQPREIGMFTRPRVLLREITAPLPYCLYAVFTADPYLNNKSILNILHPNDSADELKALACVLNSRLLSVFYKNHAVKGARTIFPKVVIKNLRQFPFPRSLSQETLNKLVAWTDTAMALHKRLSAAKTDHERTLLERQISATDHKIDRLVYDIYGLTEKEIEIVEEIA